MSHYQLSLSQEFIKIYGDDYCFIATEKFPEEMLQYGVPDLNRKDFVLRTYDGPDAYREAMLLAEEAECLFSAVFQQILRCLTAVHRKAE